jgi:hypothetical protein
MTQDEYNAALASGSAKVETESADAPSAPVESGIDLEQFVSILVALQSTQRCLSAAPTFIPQTFQDQIQFVFDGTNYSVYFYFNNHWTQVSGVTGVNQILAGSGISISPVGGTGTVTITNTITDATLPTSDITTNNVSTTKHGFAPKLPNDATKYLDGTGAYSVPAGGGGGGSNPKTGFATRGLANASSTQTIPHGLGSTPSYVRFMGSANFGSAFGTFDGTNMNGVYGFSGTPNSAAGTNVYVLWFVDGTNGQEATITVDATNIYLAWTKAGTGLTGVLSFIWEAYK